MPKQTSKNQSNRPILPSALSVKIIKKEVGAGSYQPRERI